MTVGKRSLRDFQQSESRPEIRANTRLVLVTGMSGAGKSTVLKSLEDSGYEAVDNIPISLISRLVGKDSGTPEALAIDVDIRTRDFSAEAFDAEIGPLLARSYLDVKIVFVDCEDEVLRRRFSETRRRHPLAGDRPLIDGIRHERNLVGWLRTRAHIDIDTTSLAVSDLRRMVAKSFSLQGGSQLSVFVTSFSYKFGVPREADLVFDARFLANPHYHEELRHLSGLDADVGAFIRRDSGFTPFLDGVADVLIPLLPRFEREGKSYLTIAIGCTGGRHRSVFVARCLTDRLSADGRAVHLRHRDINTTRD
jgi:UPF0042 nucleotide-binding protein